MNTIRSDYENAVIMSIHNTKFSQVKSAVASILNQSFEEFDFIIVLDGDFSSKEYLLSLDDPRIVILENEKRMGLGYSINKAISFTKAKNIFRMDSDDISSFDRLATQISYEKKGYNLLSSSCYVIDEKNNIIGKSRIYPFHNIIRRFQMYFLGLNPVIHPSVLIKREILLKYKYDPKMTYAQDFDLWMRMSNEYKFYFMKERLIYYRKHQYNVNKVSEQRKNHKLIWNKRKSLC